MSAATSVQFRVSFGKKDEAVEGPDDADVVVTVPVADAGLDPAVAFMQGRLKAVGKPGAVLDVLREPETAATLRRLAIR